MPRLIYLCTSSDFVHHLHRALHHLAARGYEVHLACCRTEQDELRTAPYSNLRNVAVHNLPFSRSISPWQDLVALVACRRLLRQLRPDLVHAHNPKAGLLGMMAASWEGIPRRIYHVHGLPYASLHGGRRLLMHSTETLACRLAHRVLCVSSSVRDALSTSCGVASEKLGILGNGSAQGIDTDHFRRAAVGREADQLRSHLGLSSADQLVLFAGRYHKEKGLDLLERAWPEVLDRCPRAHLLLIGKEDKVNPWNICALTRMPHVQALPFLCDPRPAYAAAQLHVLPSKREGLPTTVLEAAAMEVPSLVSSAVGCVDAVRHNQTGRIVFSRTPSAWADAIAELLEDASERQLLGQTARRWMLDDFQPDPILHDLDQCYRELGIG